MDDPTLTRMPPRPAAGLPPADPPEDEPDPEGEDRRRDWTERLTRWRHRAGLDSRALAWVVAAVAAGVVAMWLLRPSPAPVEEAIPTAPLDPAPRSAGPGAPGPSGGTGATGTASSAPAEVVAHAAGAVARPGVYTLDPGARVDDLVRAAGGPTPDADLARVNLAAPLTDGARVYLPRLGEQEPPVVGPDRGSPPSGEGSGTDPAPALVNINTAGIDELDELPGVGPSIAAAIVAHREENGGFTSVEQLLDVRGIGEAKLAEIRDLVTL